VLHTTRVLGSRTAYARYGAQTGAPVVLVHGFRGDHHGLEGIAEALVRRDPNRQVLVPDLPGFGDSEPISGRQHNLELYAQWLQEFADALELGTHTVLSHSFGTLITAAALAKGYRPRALVLVNPINSPALEGPQKALSKLAVLYYQAGRVLPNVLADALLAHPLIVRGMSEVMAKTRDRKLRRWIHAQHAQYFSRYADRTVLLDAFTASISHTVAEYSQYFTAPTCVIAGDRDDVAPLISQIAFDRRLRTLDRDHQELERLHILPGVGHLSHYEAPEEVAEIALSFWKSLR
jgi:pimeloyl-ACP methyl ester carboxylesterase